MSVSLRAISAAVIVMATFVTGCGAASDAAGDAVETVTESKTATFHGRWRGEDGREGPAKVHLEQHALTASATVTLDGHPCAERIYVEGKMTMDGFEGKVEAGAMHLALDGDPSLKEMIGNFAAIAEGPCPGKRGFLTTSR